MCKLICLAGAPGAGKTTTATELTNQLKANGIKTGLSEEYARSFIAKYGHPEHTALQFHVLEQQLLWEDRAKRDVEFAFTDTAVWFSYLFPKIYRKKSSSKQELLVLEEIYQRVLRYIPRYTYTFYLPLRDEIEDDGIRVPGESPKIDGHIREFLETHEPYFPHLHFLPEGMDIMETRDYILERIHEREYRPILPTQVA